RLDIERFIAFLKKENIRTFSEVDHHVIRLFLTDLHKEKLSRKSVSRIISCLRSFYKLMERENVIRQNPFIHIHLPKQEKKLPSFFYADELEQLFSVSDLEKPLGQRDQAILELLY